MADDAVTVTEWPGDVFSVYDATRKRHYNAPDGDCAWVVRRFDAVDNEFFWWCLWHKQAGCSDVKLVKITRADFGVTDPGDDTDNKE